MEGEGASSLERRVLECCSKELPLHSRQKQHITHQKDMMNGKKKKKELPIFLVPAVAIEMRYPLRLMLGITGYCMDMGEWA